MSNSPGSDLQNHSGVTTEANPVGNAAADTPMQKFGAGVVNTSATDETVTATSTDGITWQMDREQVGVITVDVTSQPGKSLYDLPLNTGITEEIQKVANGFTEYRFDSVKLSLTNTAAIASASGGIRMYIQDDPVRSAARYNTKIDSLRQATRLVGGKMINVRTSGEIVYSSPPGAWKYCLERSEVTLTDFGHIGVVVASPAVDGEATWVLTLSVSVQFRGKNHVPPSDVTEVRTEAQEIFPPKPEEPEEGEEPEEWDEFQHFELINFGGTWYVCYLINKQHNTAVYGEGTVTTDFDFEFSFIIEDEESDNAIPFYVKTKNLQLEERYIEGDRDRLMALWNPQLSEAGIRAPKFSPESSAGDNILPPATNYVTTLRSNDPDVRRGLIRNCTGYTGKPGVGIVTPKADRIQKLREQIGRLFGRGSLRNSANAC